eukprot:SAG11_NODE_3883_length_2170_cov_1.552390_2_plen_89_part_00
MICTLVGVSCGQLLLLTLQEHSVTTVNIAQHVRALVCKVKPRSWLIPYRSVLSAATKAFLVGPVLHFFPYAHLYGDVAYHLYGDVAYR